MASNPLKLDGGSVDLTLVPHMFPDDFGAMEVEISAELSPNDQRMVFVETSVMLLDIDDFRKQLLALNQPGSAILKGDDETFSMTVTRTAAMGVHVDSQFNWRSSEGLVVAFSARHEIDDAKLADMTDQVRLWVGR